MRPFNTLAIRLALGFTCVLAQPLFAAESTIAVASNFTLVMQEIVQRFQQETPHRIHPAYASSGKLYAQIYHGAPYDAFLSADQDKPQRLIQQGLAIPSSAFTYAEGRLALWSANPLTVDSQGSVLTSGAFNKLALANPKLAPYGVAAVQTLNHLGLQEATRPLWVQGENIGQTYQFVRSANAQLGFVALSQIQRPQIQQPQATIEGSQIPLGSAWIVPNEFYSPIKQDAVLLQRGHNNPATLALLDYLKTPDIQALIASYGYHMAANGR